MKQLSSLLIFSITLLFFSSCSQKQQKASGLQKVFLEGEIQGSTYHITYLDAQGRNFHNEIKAELARFDKSLSVFDSTSVISRINKNDSTVEVDTLFKYVFRIAQEVSEKTNGAFDMTVGPLVKLWGFNNGQRITVTQDMVDSLKPFIGYQKVRLEGNKIIKDDPNIQLDANAIAQGFSCDIIGNLLESKGIKNYMVEIGGEIMTKGKSPRNDAWRIGINKPIDDSTSTVNEIADIAILENTGLATSGNYRKFYYHDGKKYGHEIDPHTGFPITHKLLSVTVLAPNCITADAYATAFMVMGTVKSIHLLQKLPGVEAYFIYQNDIGKIKTIYTRGFWKRLESNQISSVRKDSTQQKK
jgi:thiamine biosynthesis lipoprotein